MQIKEISNPKYGPRRKLLQMGPAEKRFNVGKNANRVPTKS